MPAPKLYVEPVPDEVEQELETLRRQAVGRVSQRAHMVLLSLRGFSVDEIALIFNCGEDVVRNWLHRFEHRGEHPLAQVLEDAPRSGRPPKDPLAPHIIDAQASQSPPCFGLLQSCWTVTLLAVHLAVQFGLVLSPSAVRGYLHRLRWGWGRPKLTVENIRRQSPRLDPEAPAKLSRLAQVWAWACNMPSFIHFVFVDETDLCLLPVLRSCWQKRGQQKHVPTPGKDNPKRTVFGALDIIKGNWFHHIDPGRTSVHFQTLLETIERAYPTGLLVIALDSAPAHTAKRIQRWLADHPRVRFLWLPKYSAHKVNPVEKIWWGLKGTIAANRYYGQIEPLVQAARRFFAERGPRDLLRLAGLQAMPYFVRLT